MYICVYMYVCIHECFACMHVCAPSACLMSRDQKRALDPLELQLQALVSCHVDARNQTQGPL